MDTRLLLPRIFGALSFISAVGIQYITWMPDSIIMPDVRYICHVMSVMGVITGTLYFTIK